MKFEFIPDKKYMLEALALAEKSRSIGEVPVGAVIELNGKIIGRGYNTRESRQDPMGHAEIMAITEASKALRTWRLDGANLYVTLEPCPMCAGAVINARISRVIFGAEDKLMGSCGSSVNLLGMKNIHKCLMFRNFMEDECRTLIRDFFDNLRNSQF